MRLRISFVASLILRGLILCGILSKANPLSALPALATACYARATDTATVPAPATLTFDTVVESLSQRAHAPFVFEGRPYRSRVAAESPWETEDGKALLSGPTLSAPDAAQKLADIYDYHLSVEKGVYCFRKKFTHSNDLPDVGFDECLLSFEDALRSVKAFMPPDRVLPMADLRQAMSNEQFAALLTEDGIRVQQLDGESRSVVWEEALRRSLPLRNTSMVLTGLKSTRQDSTVYLWLDSSGNRLLGFEKTVGGRVRRGYLSGLSQVTTRRGFTMTLLHPGPDGKNIPEVYPPDPAGATPKDYDAAGNPLPLPQEASRNAISLTVLIGKLTRPDSPSPAISPEIGGKIVTVIGAENAPPEQVLVSVATVCGLTVRTTDAGTLLLSRRPARAAGLVTDVPAMLLRSLPDALTRCLVGNLPRATKLVAADTLKAMNLPETPENEAKLKFLAVPAAGRTEDEIYRALLKRLRVLIEPKVAASKTGRIYFKDLSDEEQSLIGLMIAVDCLGDIQAITTQLSPLLTGNFGDVVLKGSLLPMTRGGTDQGLLTLQFGRRASGTFKFYLQTSGALTPPVQTK